MAGNDYTRGEMEIEAQSKMFDGTMKAGAWSMIIILMMLAYSTFVLSLGMPWLVALGLTAIGGIAVGLIMGYGAAWVATVIALSVLGVVIQVLVMLTQWAVS